MAVRLITLVDTEGIHENANTTDQKRLADIVFVHGLGIVR